MSFRVKKILMILLISLLSVGLVVALVLIERNSDDKICEKINLEVSDYDEFQFISNADVSAHLLASGLYPVGMHQSKINLTAIENKLLELNMIKDVICNFCNNGDVNISVTQRVPLFRVKDAGVDYYVDNERKRMSTSIRFSAYVPVVSGNPDFEYASTELYDFIQYLQSERRWSSAFTQICVDPDNEIELIPRVGDFIVRFGSLERYESKFDKLDRFLEVMPIYNSWDKYSVINLEFRDQVVCTKRKKY